jgi:hypothetical protein
MRLELTHPMTITPRLMAGLKVGKAFISIEYAGVSPDRRWIYRYHIDRGSREFTGEDLKSGVGGGSIQQGLTSLLSFLTAAAEGGENADLFPPEIVEWAAENRDELSCLEIELEENRNLCREVVR